MRDEGEGLLIATVPGVREGGDAQDGPVEEGGHEVRSVPQEHGDRIEDGDLGDGHTHEPGWVYGWMGG